MLYLFDDSGRASAKTQLLDDIPRLVTEAGDAISVMEFYESIYNVTRRTLTTFMRRSSKIGP